MTGIQSSLMSNYIGGTKSPTIKNAVLIADALHISLDALVGKESLPLLEEAQSPKALAELYEAEKELSEREQLFLLDTIKSLKKRFSK